MLQIRYRYVIFCLEINIFSPRNPKFNAKPHGSGRICPHSFQIKKRQFLPVLGLRTGQSPNKSYWMCLPSLTAAASLPTSRWGGSVAVGGGGIAANQGKSPFTAKMRLFICQLSASQTSKHFLLETKDVGF
jgi:hypothetical protein